MFRTAVFFLTLSAVACIKFGPWTKMPGRLTHVSMGSKGVWGLNKDGTIYRLDGSDYWTHMGDGWRSVSSGDEVWGIKTDSTIYR